MRQSARIHASNVPGPSGRRLGHNSHIESAWLAQLLSSGGDSRIAIDPATGRNRYGTRLLPSPDEISFSSTTANNVSEAAFEHVAATHGRVRTNRHGFAALHEDWYDRLHADIIEVFGVAGAQSILTASGTDAEIIALAIVAGARGRPLTNIFIAPDETGQGVPVASTGRHFQNSTALGVAVPPNTPIEGLVPAGLETQTVGIRNHDDSPRTAVEIDHDATLAVEQALRRGRDVLLHVLDCSKTGLQGVSRKTARRLMREGAGRVRVVVDACQLRCPIGQVRQDLADGMMVIVTGSKFGAGPPFCGALLLPLPIAAAFVQTARLPSGLGAYSAICDWSPKLRPVARASLSHEGNIGLALRWAIALESIRPLSMLGDAMVQEILCHFHQTVLSLCDSVKYAHPFYRGDVTLRTTPSIVSIVVPEEDGRPSGPHAALRFLRALRNPDHGPICHVGQPVTLKTATVLRVAASARDVVSVANGLAAGRSISCAFDPIKSDLHTLFSKWAAIASTSRRG